MSDSVKEAKSWNWKGKFGEFVYSKTTEAKGKLGIPGMIALNFAVFGGAIATWILPFFFPRFDGVGVQFTAFGLILIGFYCTYHLESEVRKATAVQKDHLFAHEKVHHMIHGTRDSLFVEGGLAKINSDPENSLKQLLSIIHLQLGYLQEAISRLSGSECRVVLKSPVPDNKGNVNWVSMSYGPGIDPARRGNMTPIPEGKGLLAKTVETGQVQWTEDILKDDDFYPPEPALKKKLAERYRTVASFPVKMGDTVEAVLCFDWKEPHMYSEDYREVLACFTDTISMAFYICAPALSRADSAGSNPEKTHTR